MDKITLALCLIELYCDSKSRLQLLINPNILWEQMDTVQSIYIFDHVSTSDDYSNLYEDMLTFLIPQLTNEPFPGLVGLSRTIPSRYSDSSSILMW